MIGEAESLKSIITLFSKTNNENMFCSFSCTRDDDPSNKLWCSTRVDARGRHVTNAGNWGHCSETCNDIVINRQGNDLL